MWSKALPRVGLWLFQRRSFLGLASLPLALIGLNSFTFIASSHELTEWWQVACFAVSLSGLALRSFTVGFVPRGTSSRNTWQPIAPALNTSGMYSVVRHPLYLGNYLAVLGCLLFFHQTWIVPVGTALFAALYKPITLSEEAFLRERFGDVFDTWAGTTPAWIPRWTAWRYPELPFCWRTVLSREYTGLFVVCAVFFLLDLTGDWIASGRCNIDGWSAVVVLAGLLYAILRTLKRRTGLLDVDGR
jgi:protein-S-isoprenylcysteine O-methyltransferase Ste14